MSANLISGPEERPHLYLISILQKVPSTALNPISDQQLKDPHPEVMPQQAEKHSLLRWANRWAAAGQRADASWGLAFHFSG